MSGQRRVIAHSLGLGALLAIAGGVWTLGVQERVRQRESFEVARASLRAESRRLAQEQVRLEELRERLLAARAEAAQVEEIITSVREQNKVLGRITRIASQHRLSVDKVEPRGVKAVHDHEILNVHVAGRGKFPDVVEYLAQLHRELRNVEIDRWSLTGRPLEEQFSGRFELDLAWHMEPTAPPED